MIYCTLCGCEMGSETGCRISNFRTETSYQGERYVFTQHCHGALCPNPPFRIWDGGGGDDKIIHISSA